VETHQAVVSHGHLAQEAQVGHQVTVWVVQAETYPILHLLTVERTQVMVVQEVVMAIPHAAKVLVVQDMLTSNTGVHNGALCRTK
jgi:hypothetical protein